MKHVQTIINDFDYQKLFYICGKLNITIYELIKNFVDDFIKKNINLIPKDKLERISNGFFVSYKKGE
jgi:hypothetical protein